MILFLSIKSKMMQEVEEETVVLKRVGALVCGECHVIVICISCNQVECGVIRCTWLYLDIILYAFLEKPTFTFVTVAYSI